VLEVNLPGRMLKIIMRKSIEAHVKGSFKRLYVLRSNQFQQRAKKYGSKEVGGLNLFIFSICKTLNFEAYFSGILQQNISIDKNTRLKNSMLYFENRIQR